MEKLQGLIHPCFPGCQVLEEQLDIGCLEDENVDLGLNYGLQYVNPESLRFEEYINASGVPAPSVSASHTLPNLEDKMPFLQMLRSFDYPPAFQEPNFQFLLRLQQQQQEKLPSYLTVNTELESCVTNEIVELDLHSPVKQQQHQVQQQHQEEEVQVPIEKSCTDFKPKRCLLDSTKVQGRSRRQNQMHNKTPVVAGKERRKRKRTRPAKNKEEVETQRMAHIAVERNRRRQMNEHLGTLRTMMPPSYVQRGDQASIIGGAIDFVKELEQLLQSLQAQKRMKNQAEETGDASASSSSTTSSSSNMLNSLFMASPAQFSNSSNSHLEDGNSGGVTAEAAAAVGGCGDEFMAENRSEIADIGAVVIHNHVSLKVHCKRRQGQLLKAIFAFEDLRLSVLHLNITSMNGLVDYSFNLKIEDDCNLRSADEIVGAVHRVFSLINSS